MSQINLFKDLRFCNKNQYSLSTIDTDFNVYIVPHTSKLMFFFLLKGNIMTQNTRLMINDAHLKIDFSLKYVLFFISESIISRHLI
jgi:hypothetical protein